MAEQELSSSASRELFTKGEDAWDEVVTFNESVDQGIKIMNE